MVAKALEKREFRERNLQAASRWRLLGLFDLMGTHTCIYIGSPPDSSVVKKLDGSVKKNTAFVKKLVSLNNSLPPDNLYERVYTCVGTAGIGDVDCVLPHSGH